MSKKYYILDIIRFLTMTVATWTFWAFPPLFEYCLAANVTSRSIATAEQQQISQEERFEYKAKIANMSMMLLLLFQIISSQIYTNMFCSNGVKVYG